MIDSENKKQIATQALSVIQAELAEAKQCGERVDAVFVPNRLRYIIAAHPGSALTHILGQGDLIYGVPMVRYVSDDLSKVFVARACPLDGAEAPEGLLARWQTPMEAAEV